MNDQSQAPKVIANIDTERNVITIELPLNNPPKESKSGKTLLVGSTNGAYETACVVNGQKLVANLNLYIYKDPVAKAAKKAVKDAKKAGQVAIANV